MTRKKIVEKIEAVHLEIHTKLNSGDEAAKAEAEALAAGLKRLASQAILGGLGSSDWRVYMEYFAAGDVEHLRRLTGLDRQFNESEWGKESIAYMVANSTCDVTTTGRTTNNMTPEMIDNFDYGLDYT